MIVKRTMLPPLWRIARRLAWRDLRASRIHSAFIAATMAISIASLAGIRSASDAARHALQSRSREWLAADLTVNTKTWMDDEQLAALERLKSEHIDFTVVTSALSMAGSDQSPETGLILVKAVDPTHYPFYGTIELTPPVELRTALDAESVVVSEDLLRRLQVRSGDRIRIGAQWFRIAAVIRAEPDRFAGTPGAGMRCILSRAGYTRSEIARGGNSELHRILLRLPGGVEPKLIRLRLQDMFPDASVLDYREATSPVVSALDTAVSSLGTTTLFALALGVAGVALAVREHVERRMQTVAVMKMLGGRSGQISAIFLLEVACMMAAALFVSMPLAWTVQMSALSFARKFVPVDALMPDFRALGENALAILIAAAPALAQLVTTIRRLRPAIVLRRDTGERRPGHFPGEQLTLEQQRTLAKRYIATPPSSGMHDFAQSPRAPPQAYPVVAIAALIKSLFSTFDTPRGGGFEPQVTAPKAVNEPAAWHSCDHSESQQEMLRVR